MLPVHAHAEEELNRRRLFVTNINCTATAEHIRLGTLLATLKRQYTLSHACRHALTTTTSLVDTHVCPDLSFPTRAFFSNFGPVLHVHVLTEGPAGQVAQSRGMAQVTMSTPEAAAAVLERRNTWSMDRRQKHQLEGCRMLPGAAYVFVRGIYPCRCVCELWFPCLTKWIPCPSSRTGDHG